MTLSEPIRARIEQTLQQSRVVLFMKGNKHFPQCGFSATVVKILGEVGAPYDTVNVLADAEIRDGIKEFGQWPTIPQLYVDGKLVGGCDIVKDLFASGELHPLLGKEAGKGGNAGAPAPLPTIRISPAAAAAIKAADDGSGDLLRIEINPAYAYDLYFGPKDPADVQVESGGVVVRLDPSSASRADGLTIEWVEHDGAFKIESPHEPPRVKPLSAQAVKAMMDAGDAFELYDVRTDAERRTAKIDRAKHLDASGEAAIGLLDKSTKLVFHCHHGVRSRAAAEHYVQAGFRNVYNLEGGIDAWSQTVDKSVARY